jgi:hypothetical protein
LNEVELAASVARSGDHSFEFVVPGLPSGKPVTAEIEIDPPCLREPAFRCAGLTSGQPWDL